MARTHAQIDQAAAEAEAWLDSMNPDDHPATDITALQAIGMAKRSVATAEAELEARVAEARAAGFSWGRISLALGVSEQAAVERFDPQ